MNTVYQLILQLKFILILAKRDYAMQYAGTLFGILWLFVQYVFQIAVYYILFGVIFKDGGRFIYEGDYFLYIMTGMMLWFPVSEMMIRSCSILYDNRSLVKRSGAGIKLFVRVPAVQGIFYYLILFWATFVISIIRNEWNFISILSLFYGFILIILFSLWGEIFSKISLILKDFTPVMRLIFQIFFWMTPVIYAVPDEYRELAAWNPFYGFIELNRYLFFNNYSFSLPDLKGVMAFAVITAAAYIVSKIRLERVALDQL